MIIWFENSCTTKNQPPASSIVLRGIYNPPGHSEATSIIQIKLEISLSPEDTIIHRTMYEHNPTMLRQEDPNPSDILFKYQPQINRIIQRLFNMTFEDLIR